MRTTFFALALVATLAFVSASSNSTMLLGSVQSCGGAGYKATNVVATVTPSNPQPGDSYTYTASYDLSETITGGNEKVAITLRGFPVSTTTKPLCTALKGTDTPCPIQAGHITSVTKGTVPADTPSGELVATASWTDQNGDPVLCIKLSFDIQ